MSDHKSDVAAESLLLLELALTVGRMLKFDLERRCREFLRILLARKNLSYGAVWIRSSALRRVGDDETLELIYALPAARAGVKKIADSHPSMTVLKQDRFHIVRDSDPGFHAQTLEPGIETGCFASLRLGNIGALRLYSTKQTSFSNREINQLYGLIEIFTISIEGALSQSRLEEEAKERKLIDDKLRQTEKLRAVGQLTGGVAHDFNNLLAVIQGNAELLVAKKLYDDAFADPILRSTMRGAELTQRLLAFSRQQALSPQPIDLGALVLGMSDLLTRTLGETIEIEIGCAPDLANALADPGQVESALLNLTLNARDAMPGGGKLTVECSNARLDPAYVAENPEARAGDYVVLAVSDEGTGMTADVRAHAFEPFFTTKEVGQGSGLGLSMVYGFVKQTGGHVTIYSEQGLGTTVKLYLPHAGAAARHEEASRDQDVPLGKGESVLVIEDDPDVRELTVRILVRLNYRVIDVPDATAAHEALAQGQSFDLVLSDVVLPGGISGPEFAEHVRKIYPDLKIIFMSGYPADAAKRNGFLGSDQVLLNKPFHRHQLAKALRKALD